MNLVTYIVVYIMCPLVVNIWVVTTFYCHERPVINLCVCRGWAPLTPTLPNTIIKSLKSMSKVFLVWFFFSCILKRIFLFSCNLCLYMTSVSPEHFIPGIFEILQWPYCTNENKFLGNTWNTDCCHVNKKMQLTIMQFIELYYFPLLLFKIMHHY